MKNIRKATMSDISRIAEIEIFNYRLNFYPIFKNDMSYFHELQVENEIEKFRQNNSLIDGIYVYDDSVIKGFIKINGQEIKKLFVEPVLHGQGVGTKLLSYAVKHQSASFLWVLEKNTRAINFYRRNGFYLTGDKMIEEDTTEYLVRMERQRLS